MLKIQTDRVIIDGHESTTEQCETMTLLANALAESNNFKTVEYRDGYAEFEKVGKSEELKFKPGGFRVAVDLNTLPGWEALSSGSHNITIVAKANGFKDSAPSAAVQVEKEQPTPETRVKTWNLSERTEEKPYSDTGGTYVLDTSTGLNNLIFTVGHTDKVYWTGGYIISTPKIFNGDQSTEYFSSISSVTSNGFNFTAAASHTESFMMIPYQVKAGETITWTYTRTGTNRGGYILFDSQGLYISATLLNRSGSGTTTETVSITQDGWILVCFGKYDANATVTFSDCSLNIS